MARKRTTEEVEDFDDLEEEDYEEFDEDLDEVDDEEEAKASKAKSKAKPASKKDSKPKGITARAIAEKLGVEPKSFRAWLRSQVSKGEASWVSDLAGRDGKERYDFGSTWNSDLVKGILTSYKEWSESAAERRKANAENLAKGREKAAANKAKSSPKKPAAKRSSKAKS